MTTRPGIQGGWAAPPSQALATTDGTPPGEAGFTLLEVLVALAILGLAVVSAIQLFAGGLRLLKQAGDHQRATLIADQKARDASVLRAGHETGSEGPFTWERRIAVAEVPGELAATGTIPLRLYTVSVRVSWGEGTRGVDLATLRTALEPLPGVSPTASGPHR
jgi:general secretion pathway protein I